MKKENQTNLTLEEVMNQHKRISLKRICEELNLCYQYVLKASKQPIPNQPYDPSAFNYEAVQKILDKKEVNLDDINWDEVEQSIKVVTPVNKAEDFNIGVHFTLRKNETYYSVVYVTETHIVFIDASLENTQPRVMNWETFLHQSPRIVAHD